MEYCDSCKDMWYELTDGLCPSCIAKKNRPPKPQKVVPVQLEDTPLPQKGAGQFGPNIGLPPKTLRKQKPFKDVITPTITEVRTAVNNSREDIVGQADAAASAAW